MFGLYFLIFLNAFVKYFLNDVGVVGLLLGFLLCFGVLNCLLKCLDDFVYEFYDDCCKMFGAAQG